MPNASVTYSFSNNTNADANQVNTNFADLVSWINNYAIQPSVATFTVFPTLPSTSPTNAYHAVHKAYVDSAILPVGMISPYAGSTAPASWLFCDGAELLKTNPTYAALFAVIGTTYGETNGSGGAGTTHFRVPSLKGRVPVGRDSADSLFDMLAETGGAVNHTLTEAQMPAHTHGMNNHVHAIDHNHAAATTSSDAHTHTLDVEGTSYSSHNHATASGSDSVAGTPSSGSGVVADSGQVNSDSHTHTVDLPNFTGSSGASAAGSTSTGGGQAHNNLQPYIVVNYIIKL